MWKFLDLASHKRKLYRALTRFSVLQLLECLSQYICSHNLTMKFPPDFHNYTGLNNLVNFFSFISVALLSKLILDCFSLNCKEEKNSIMCEGWGGSTWFQNTEIPITFFQKYCFTVGYFSKHRNQTFLLHPKYLYVSQGNQT